MSCSEKGYSMKGLVLEGGGARGAYQVGAVKALNEMGIVFNGVAGTSIGSLNGALIVQGRFDLLYEMWQKVNLSMIFDVDVSTIEKIRDRALGWNDFHYLLSELRHFIMKRGLDASRIKLLINELVDEEQIRQSGIDFGIVTVSLSDFKPLELYIEDIPEGKLSEYLMASANFPAFRLEKLDGKYFIDGGIHDNLPINMLISKGYTDFISIRIFGIGIVKKVLNQDINILEISPSEDLGYILDFNPARIKYNMTLGYFDAYKALQHLLGHRYYLRVDSNTFFENEIMSISTNQISLLQKLLFVHGLPLRRTFLEEIIPSIAKLLNLASDISYAEIYVCLLEYAADYIQLDRFKIYDYLTFKQKIIDSYAVIKQQEDFHPQGKSQFDGFVKFNKKHCQLIIAGFIICGLDEVELTWIESTLSKC